jgi:hypothetical protein
MVFSNATSKPRSFKYVKKEEKKMDPVRLVTIEFGSEMRYSHQIAQNISNELDEVLKSDITKKPNCKIQVSIESNSACPMNERRNTNISGKVSSKSVLPLEIDMIRQRRMLYSSSKDRNNAVKQYIHKNERIISCNKLQKSKIDYKYGKCLIFNLGTKNFQVLVKIK